MSFFWHLESYIIRNTFSTLFLQLDLIKNKIYFLRNVEGPDAEEILKTFGKFLKSKASDNRQSDNRLINRCQMSNATIEIFESDYQLNGNIFHFGDFLANKNPLSMTKPLF